MENQTISKVLVFDILNKGLPYKYDTPYYILNFLITIHCKLGKRVRTESELSDALFTKYLVNTEVISKKRLHREQNIYANRYPDTSKCFIGFAKLFLK